MFASGASRIAARIRRALRALGRVLRTPTGAAFALMLVVITGYYASNLNTRDLDSPRDAGEYRPFLARGDGHYLYLMLQSLALDGDFDFTDELKAHGDPFEVPFQEQTRRPGIPHPIGPAVLWSPLFYAAHGLSKIANVFGAGIPAHGYTRFHQRIVFLSSPLFAWAACLLSFLAVRRMRLGSRAPVVEAALALFGTTITYYATYAPSYGHAMDAAVCAAFFAYWALTLGDTRWRRFILLGALVGVAAMIRVTGFALGLALMLEIFWRMVRPPGGARSARERVLLPLARGALALAVALVAFAPQMIYWKTTYCGWVVSPMGDKFMRLSEPQWLEVLFSGRAGWLSNHPLAYLGVIGLFLLPRRHRLLQVGLLTVSAAMVYLNSCVFDWWAGASFGQRRLSSLTFVVVVGLTCALWRGNRLLARGARVRYRWAAATMLLLPLVLWNLSKLAPLRGGVRVPGGVAPWCCHTFVEPLRPSMSAVYRTIGNPFAFPASAYFAIEHDMPLHRWDVVVGNYYDIPFHFHQYERDRHLDEVYKFDLPNRAVYLQHGIGPRQIAKKVPFRWTTRERASFLLPLLVPEGHRLVLPVRANLRAGTMPVQVYVNGELVHEELLKSGKRTPLRFEVPASVTVVGLNTVAIEAPLRAHEHPELPAHPAGKPVGVALLKSSIGWIKPETQPESDTDATRR